MRCLLEVAAARLALLLEGTWEEGGGVKEEGMTAAEPAEAARSSLRSGLEEVEVGRAEILGEAGGSVEGRLCCDAEAETGTEATAAGSWLCLWSCPYSCGVMGSFSESADVAAGFATATATAESDDIFEEMLERASQSAGLDDRMSTGQGGIRGRGLGRAVDHAHTLQDVEAAQQGELSGAATIGMESSW